MTQRLYLHNRHYVPNKGFVTGMLTLDTALSKEELGSLLRVQVVNHLANSNYFSLPGAMRMQNPYHFVDEAGSFLEPTIETEEEYEARMNQGLPVPVTY